jgi:methylenetetrahydrofolate dehydrogenase (NADP+)/methenyltetrahydrofolate cyclohydrolase
VTSARILDGVGVANQIRAETAPEIAKFRERVGRPPGLGIVLVGDDPASEIYVRSKSKSAADSGLRADLERLPATATLPELLDVVDRLD